VGTFFVPLRGVLKVNPGSYSHTVPERTERTSNLESRLKQSTSNDPLTHLYAGMPDP